MRDATCPGLANFLKASKYYYFDRYVQKMSQNEDKQLDTFPRLLNCIISLVRYPKIINKAHLAEFADTLMQVRPLLTPYPESTAQCIEVAEKIYEIIKDYLKDEEKQKQKESASGQGDPQGNQQEPSDVNSSSSSSSGSGSAGQSSGKKMTSRQIAKKVEQGMNDVFGSIKKNLESLTGDPAKSNIASDN